MRKPAVVLDTNVLISSLWPNRCWETVKRWRDGYFTLAVSPAVLEEYLDVLGRFVTKELLAEWRLLLTDPSHVTLVEPIESINAVENDPEDNKFIECAVAAQAACIISGDSDLLSLITFRNIAILTPAVFLKQTP